LDSESAEERREEMNRLEDLREWLLDRIDGSEETRGDDSLISHFINQIDALPSTEIAEPRGCPTPGACSAVAELADLKQRILPQFQGRAQRAEHERDALLEELIVRRTAIANLHGEIDGMREKLRAATTMVCEMTEGVATWAEKWRDSK